MKKKAIWFVASCSIVVALLLASCGPAVTEEEEAALPEEEVVTAEEEEVQPQEEEVVTAEEEEEAPPPEEEEVTEEAAQPEQEEVAPPTDTTPPAAITGLVAVDAYDGRVNLSWDKSTAQDFGHYAIYVRQTEIVDASGMPPVHQIRDIARNTYQVTGLEDGAECYLAVTAVDKSGNENTKVASVSATSTPMPRGTVDPDLQIDVYESDRTCAGTTLLRDNHNREKLRIIEVNMLGEIVWEYLVPRNLGSAGDVELLPDNHILFTATNGVYEINRSGEIIWSYLTDKISHDADRLPNGNTIFVFGMEDTTNDAQVTEVNPEGEIVWRWYARDHFNEPPYNSIYVEGWTHTNAVTRLENGNTLISPRNFGLLVEVDPQGEVVRTIGEGVFCTESGPAAHDSSAILFSAHDPEVLPNGNILVVSQFAPHRAIEIDPENYTVIWQFAVPDPATWPVRDADRLPNGNTLITGAQQLIEVTAKGEIVWQLNLDATFQEGTSAGLGFYKAERIGIPR